MKKSLLKAFALSLFCVVSTLNAQNELWYFGGWNTGGNMGVAFTGPGKSPVQRNNENTRAFYEGVAVVSDGSGNLLFYSDGLFIYNKNNVKMNGGVVLHGGQENSGNNSGSSAQGAYTLKDPSNPNRYYLFTMEDVINGSANGFRYTIIDMTLNGGLGDVVPGSVDVIIRDGVTETTTEMLAAVAKNCDTTWIVMHEGGSARFAAYPMSSAGIGTPVYSTAGPVILGKNDQGRGTAAFSPDGNFLGISFGAGIGSYIFAFDKKTGTLSNTTLGPNKNGKLSNAGQYGSEWSPNGMNFYFSSQQGNAGIKQYSRITNQVTTVSATGNYGEMVLAPDGKIYVGKEFLAAPSNPNSLAVIATPDAINGAASGFNDNGFATGSTGGVWLGLPQSYYPKFDTVTTANITPVASRMCDSTSAFFLTASPILGNWTSKPAGFISNGGLFDPTVNGSDSTTVTVYFGLEPCIPTDSITIKVVNCCENIETNAPSAPICPGDSINLTSLVTAGIGSWSIGLTPPPSPGKKVATVTTPWFKTKLNTLSGNYTMVYSLSNPKVGCPDTTQEIITVKSAPNNAPSKTASFCAGDSVLISGAAGGTYTYAWNPAGETTISKYAKAGISYYLTTTDNVTSCISRDTIVVTSNALPSVNDIDTSVCAGGTINVSVPVYTSYLWDNSTTGQSTNISSTGTHWVRVTNAQNCSDTIFVNVNNGAALNVSLNNPGTICSGGTATLTATVTGINVAPLVYEWDNVVGSASKVYNAGGTYTVEVTDARNCIGTAQSSFILSAGPSVSLNADTVKCFSEGETYTASIPSGYTTIHWNGTLSTDTFFTINTANTITVIVTDNQTCADTADIVISEKCDPAKVCYPNVITPNGDNENEYFTFCKPVPESKILKMRLVIYDRWGLKMWETTDKIPMWDGKFNGNAVTPGVYYYIAYWTDSTNTDNEQTGWVQVIH